MSTTDSAAGAVHAPAASHASRERAVTVTGDVAPDSLGTVLPHEHLLSDFRTPGDTDESWAAAGRVRPVTASRLRLYRAPLTMDLLGEVGMGAPNRDNRLLGDGELSADEAAAFKLAGGDTLVDVTTIGLGRDPTGLRRISEVTGLNIVMGSGWYHPAWVEGLAGRDAGSLTEEIVRDLTEGVDGVRAGIIGELAALDPEVPAERAVLVAAARASAATGAPISLGRSGDPATQQRVLDLLAEEGADLTCVAVGHCDALSPRPDELEPLLGRGVFVQFDQLGRLPSVLSVSDDQDVATAVLELAHRGHAERILLSQDVSTKSQLLSYGGGGYGFILRQFVPYLKMLGADDALIESVTVRNPQRLLTIPTPKADS
ncbi:phosphotriesterase family protein [Streptosporangium roseum]|uniref:Phosphotriesterase protein n=1 Tax=Streptosporangium roseum (strain ATCC 12428 / DSM 43021 / JCM 3005 / KCTC 9067 / NCIMB 10171 / NRRL 2505 / NI 9100) TaxID=479432 RepID=D2AW40_STRRD|nr:phosphotriesterase [Streptosporangium roseum]ACZ84993.1 putative phosphotriesterase protein [Streptosporangium roseum DSM 43021]